MAPKFLKKPLRSTTSFAASMGRTVSRIRGFVLIIGIALLAIAFCEPTKVDASKVKIFEKHRDPTKSLTICTHQEENCEGEQECLHFRIKECTPYSHGSLKIISASAHSVSGYIWPTTTDCSSFFWIPVTLQCGVCKSAYGGSAVYPCKYQGPQLDPGIE